jgi:hypothetical protein
VHEEKVNDTCATVASLSLSLGAHTFRDRDIKEHERGGNQTERPRNKSQKDTERQRGSNVRAQRKFCKKEETMRGKLASFFATVFFDER